MNPIDLSFLENEYDVTVKGELYDSKDPILLSEDLLEIDLHRSGRTIDVGWYPEHDPSGQFRVLLYRGHTGFPLREIHTVDVFEVIDHIVSLIGQDQFDCIFGTAASVETEVAQYG